LSVPRYAVIRGTGSYYPDRILTNQDLEKIVETSDDWILTRTGIKERRIAAPEQASSDLAEQAARRALDMAGLTPQDIDHIIVATVTPDYLFPSCACTLQAKLEAPQAIAFDISAACTGFIYGLSLSRALVVSGQAKRILLIGVETLSRITDYTDRTTCVLFGDAAGAMIIEGSDDEEGILSVALGADGQYGPLLCQPGGGSRHPATAETVAQNLHKMKMNGNEVFKIAVKSLESIVDETLEANSMDRSEVDWLIPHQANIRIIQATAKRLGISMEKVILTIQDYGNTSAASIPMALDVAVRDGRIKRGQILLLEAFGGGFTWGSALLRF
jgi:3-oxoacyl-[acyl-carrier-protein] synthase-3